MNKKVRIGILGCANIAKKSSIKAFQSLKNAEVVSIASRDPQKAKEYATLFSLPTHESYESLIKNPNVDAVYIPLPIGLHKEWIIKAAKAGKHVLSEKSLTTDYGAAKDILNEVKKAKIVLYENYMCDFHPQHEKVLSLIQKGVLGDPFVFKSSFGIPLMKDTTSFRYNKDLGGSALTEVGGYTVFMARKMLQGEPLWVEATLFYDKKRHIDMRGVGQLGFNHEVTAHIAFGLDVLYQNTYSLWGTKGYMTVKRAHTIPEDLKPEIEVTKNENLKETVTQIDVPKANHFALLFHDFCETILQKETQQEKIIDTYKKVLAQAKVLEAIRISSKEKRRVFLKEIR